MLDRFTGMQVFARLVGTGSISGAARLMGMSATMATKHINALEEQLGVKLVHRTTRKVTLTEAGRDYLESVERILTEVAEAEAIAISGRVEVKGVLRVSVPVSFGVLEIAPLLPTFARCYPQLRVDLGVSDRKVDLIDEGWDVAVRIGKNPDPTMIARRLAPCHTIVAAAPAYLVQKGTPQTVADLAAHNCLIYTLASEAGSGQWFFGANQQIGVPVRGNLQASNGDVLVAAALEGQGVICEPTFLVGDHIRAGRLVGLHLDHPPAEVPGVYATYPVSRRVPAKVRAFVDFLVEQIGSPPRWDRGLALSGS